jgi:hypothetical protein
LDDSKSGSGKKWSGLCSISGMSQALSSKRRQISVPSLTALPLVIHIVGVEDFLG